MTKPKNETTPRTRRWKLVGKIVLGAVPIVSLIVASIALSLQNHAQNAAKPDVTLGFSKVDGNFVVDGIYVANTGGSDISVSTVEVLNLSYPFYDITAPSPCVPGEGTAMTCAPEMPIGVLDYSELIRARPNDAMYMSSKTSCAPAAVPIAAGGPPVAFVAVTGMPRSSSGDLLIAVNDLVPARLLTFTVKVSFVGNKIPPITKIFAPTTTQQAKPDAVAMKGDFSSIVKTCGPELGSMAQDETPAIPTGTSFERYLYVPSSRSGPAHVESVGQSKF